MNSTSSFIYNVLEWVTRFAYLNLLWILFTLAGGILLGLFPATIAMYAIVRQWLNGNTDLPVLSSYWDYFKQEFKRSNLLGLVIYAVVGFIVLDFFYIQSSPDEWSWTFAPLFAFMLLFLLFLFYLFPVYVHFELTLWRVFKNSFLLMLVNPFHNLMIIFTLVPAFMLMNALPAVAFLFGGSGFAFITMWICLHAFNRTKGKEKAAAES